ncbi:MAG: hypothetical protein RLZZ63_332 [Gemmatimonadota bacterium]|jgi:hypothetical protein
MAVLLWTYLPKEVLRPLDALCTQLQHEGHTVYALDIDGSLGRWGARPHRVAPQLHGNIVRYPDLLRQWEPIIAAGYLPHDSRSPAAKYATLEAHALRILDWIRPDAICVWNPMAPNFGILGEIARRRGVHCTYTERGVIPGSIVIDPDGLFRHARYQIANDNATAEGMETARNIGARLLRDLHAATTVRRDGVGGDVAAYATFVEQHVTRPIICIFGSPPHEHSIVPTAWADGRSSLTICADYHQLLAYLLDTLPDHAFVFKPHPHSQPVALPASKRLLVTGLPPLQLLPRSAAVIAHGSSLELTTVLLRVPLLLAGNGHLWNTDVAVSCHSLAELAQSVQRLTATAPDTAGPDDGFATRLGSYVTSRLLFLQSTANDRALFSSTVPLHQMTRTTITRTIGNVVRLRVGLFRQSTRSRLTAHWLKLRRSVKVRR